MEAYEVLLITREDTTSYIFDWFSSMYVAYCCPYNFRVIAERLCIELGKKYDSADYYNFYYENFGTKSVMCTCSKEEGFRLFKEYVNGLH